MKPNLPKDNEIKQQLTLINFNQDYYYDIKPVLANKPNSIIKNNKKTEAILPEEKVNLKSKTSLKNQIA